MSSPQTPVHSRNTSNNIDLSYGTPDNYSLHRRNSSQPPSPMGPRFNHLDSMNILSSGGAAPSNGLGNLADELADAWDEDEGEELVDEIAAEEDQLRRDARGVEERSKDMEYDE